MMIWYQTFMSFRCNDHPDETRKEARKYANNVRVADEENKIINITELLNKWETIITVWYEADKEIN